MTISLTRVKKIKTGRLDQISFEIDKGQSNFLLPFYKKIQEWEVDGNERFFDLDISVHYRPKTIDQLRLYWLMVEVMVVAQDGKFTIEGKDEIHAGLCLKYCPRQKARLTTELLPKRMSDLDTAEMAKVIEGTIRELWEMGIPFESQGQVVSEIQAWKGFINSDKVANISNTYKSAKEYREAVPYCEACMSKPGAELAHIVGDKAGGAYEPWNLMHLCIDCHRSVAHGQGWTVLCYKYPYLTGKVEKAKEESGKRPLGKAKEPEKVEYREDLF